MRAVIAVAASVVACVSFFWGEANRAMGASPPAPGHAAPNTAPITADEAHRYSALSQQMGPAFEAKNYKKMVRLCQQQVEIAHGRDQGRANYNLARAAALADQPDEAFKALSLAIDEGVRDPNRIKNDQYLESLRGDERFKKALEKAKRLHKSGGAK